MKGILIKEGCPGKVRAVDLKKNKLNIQSRFIRSDLPTVTGRKNIAIAEGCTNDGYCVGEKVYIARGLSWSCDGKVTGIIDNNHVMVKPKCDGGERGAYSHFPYSTKELVKY